MKLSQFKAIAACLILVGEKWIWNASLDGTIFSSPSERNVKNLAIKLVLVPDCFLFESS
jgi:hypothetical protein